jgi:hypothetical protein
MAIKQGDVTEKKSDHSQVVQIAPIKIVRTTVKVVGTSTLIVHAWSVKAKEQMRAKQQKLAKTAKEAKDPDADFQGAKYIDAQGRDCVPALAFKNAIVSAARFSEDLKMTVLRGAVFVVGELLPINYESCVMREDTVRVGMGTADLRYRPEYFGWSIDLPIEFNSSVLSASQVMNLVKLAGFSVGICEWRPERDGQHGRFDIAEAA